MTKHKVNSQLLFILLFVLGLIALPAAFILVSNGNNTQSIQFQGTSQDGFNYTFYARAPKDMSEKSIQCVQDIAGLYFSQHDLEPVTLATNELTGKHLKELFDGLSQVIERTCTDLTLSHNQLYVEIDNNGH